MIGEDSGKVREDASPLDGSAEWKEVEVAVIGKYSTIYGLADGGAHCRLVIDN